MTTGPTESAAAPATAHSTLTGRLRAVLPWENGHPAVLRIAAPLLYTTMILALIHTLVTIPQENPGTDFTPIFTAAQNYLAGRPVYDWDYSIDIPHYLYTPAGTVIIAPTGIIDDQQTARAVFAILGALCIIAALAIASRMLTHRWFHVLFPLATSVFFFTREPVRTTLKLTNINGFMLLLFVVFTWSSLALRRSRLDAGQPVENGWRTCLSWRSIQSHFTRPETYIAGIAAGLAFSLKPQFGMLFVLSLALGQIAVPVIAGLFSAALFAIGWFTMAQPELFITNLVPHLSEPRPNFNGSVAGLGLAFGWPEWVVTVVTVVMVAVAVVGVVKLWRLKDFDEANWAFTTLGLSFAAGFMASGLLQNYYAIWLLPMVLTVIRPRSVMHWPIMWALICVMLANPKWPDTGNSTLNLFLVLLPPLMFLALPFVITAWAFLVARPSAPATQKTKTSS